MEINKKKFLSNSLCRVQRRVQKGFEVFEYYANNQWDFDNANILHLRSLVNDIEKEKYAIQDDGKSTLFHISGSICKIFSMMVYDVTMYVWSVLYKVIL